jgi:hypothetical protein
MQRVFWQEHETQSEQLVVGSYNSEVVITQTAFA